MNVEVYLNSWSFCETLIFAIFKNRYWNTWEDATTLKAISLIDVFKNFNYIHIQVYIVKTSAWKLDVHVNQVSEGYQEKCSFSYTLTVSNQNISNC